MHTFAFLDHRSVLRSFPSTGILSLFTQRANSGSLFLPAPKVLGVYTPKVPGVHTPKVPGVYKASQ
jgi:hypothetical protein